MVLANGTIEATRLALESLGVGDNRFGSPRVGNLVAHLRSNITVRIKRAALGMAGPPTDPETVAFLVRGEALGRRFHHQVIAASVVGTDPERTMWATVPDIELLGNMLASQDPNWVTITLASLSARRARARPTRSMPPCPKARDPNRRARLRYPRPGRKATR